MLGLNLGISVILKVFAGGGRVSLTPITPGVAPSEGTWVSLSVRVLCRHRLPLQEGNCGVVSPT